ncbi:acyl-CoA thioester hydrolase/BAAT C-terminal domain-containing protein [uncultured Shewanella sp.]|uniref:acyl-CoA thioester hydrolase/BAAT C-terminal domain-containing protein n=1 Tax=uncultured Shewanella sp. TaxID=173975 RepID=UPI002612DE0E|nr:acyl-CoA thioester hydrolase/BAAT C-terminal domain-containing protein [uncultured Shewanella sp.]
MKLFTSFTKWVLLALLALIIFFTAYHSYLRLKPDAANLPEHHGKVHSQLHLSQGSQQPLLVYLGGEENHHHWNSDASLNSKQRQAINNRGYALLSLDYFGKDGIPKHLDRIDLAGVHKAILNAASHPQINPQCIALIGVSKGAELALTLGSYYPEIKAVAGIVPSHVVFAGFTNTMATSSLSINGEQLPFVPVSLHSVLTYFTQDLKSSIEIMLQNEEAVENAAIKVEDIQGPILFMSAINDRHWPSTEMSEKMMQRLRDHDFAYHFEHITSAGEHGAWMSQDDKIYDFFEEHLIAKNPSDCSRNHTISIQEY